MGFRESVAVCMRKFADFDGRARRAEFWWFVLFVQLISVALIAVPYIIVIVGLIASTASSKDGNPEFTTTMGVGVVLLVAGMIVSLILTIPYLAAQARRLHDTGQSGHWLWFHLAGLGIVPLIMCIMEGQPHANQWGPDPKAAERWNAGYPTYPPQAAAPTPWPGQAPQPPAGYAQAPVPQPPAPQPPVPQAPIGQPGSVPPPPMAAPPAGQPLNPAPEDPFATPPQQ